jgi:hypothetical protein
MFNFFSISAWELEAAVSQPQNSHRQLFYSTLGSVQRFLGASEKLRVDLLQL